MARNPPANQKQIFGRSRTRVALASHKSPVTQIISEALGMVKQANPGLRLVVSYAALTLHTN